MTHSLDGFNQFFEACVGQWSSERTYHYLSRQAVERSHTNFTIAPLSADQKNQVLTDNHYPLPQNVSAFPGFHLGFQTVSDQGDRVAQTLNFVFVYHSVSDRLIEGDYLRDRAYEEAQPMVSHFAFHPLSRELLMTTTYTRVISVDSITLVNPRLRIRRILNYHRPPEGSPLSDLALAGFGVEQKGV
jgi:hypothetical protein